MTDKRADGEERPWQRHKRNSMKIADMYEKALEMDTTCISESRLKSLRDCAGHLLFGINSEGKRKIVEANFCRMRTCPMCNWRKSSKLFGQMKRIVDLVLKEKKSTRFIFVTLTSKSCKDDELPMNLDKMNRALKYLTGKNQTFSPAAKFKKSLSGYMKSMEVAYNSEENTYQLHIHCIFAVKAGYFRGQGYIKQEEWAELWGQCAKLDYLPSVEIKAIKNMEKAIAELAKYPLKMDEIAELGEKAIPALITYSHVLKKRRLITFGGVMADAKKRLALDDIENGNLIHIQDE